MSAIAATSISQIGILAALPQPVPRTPQLTPAFNGLINALFGSAGTEPAPTVSTQTPAPSKEIAGALIRSMFRGATFDASQPVTVTTPTLSVAVPQPALSQPQALPAKEIASALVRSMLRGVTFPASQQTAVLATPATTIATNYGPVPAAPAGDPPSMVVPVTTPDLATAAPPKEIASAPDRSMPRQLTPVLATPARKNALPPMSPAAPTIVTNNILAPIAPAGVPSSVFPLPEEEKDGQLPAGIPAAVQSAPLPDDSMIASALASAPLNPPSPFRSPVAIAAATKPPAKAASAQAISIRRTEQQASPSIAVLAAPTPAPNTAPAAQPPMLDFASPISPVVHRDIPQVPTGDAEATQAPAARPDIMPRPAAVQPQSEVASTSGVSFAAILTPISLELAYSKSGPASAIPTDPTIPNNSPSPAAEKPVDDAPLGAPAGDPGTGTAPRRDGAKAAVITPPSAPQMPQDFAPALIRATETISMPRAADIKAEAPPAVAADALRASEIQPAAPAVPPPASGASTQELSFRLSQPAAPPVDLHVTERGGEIRVSVRTPDATLETSLRQNLPALANSLERAGYHAETFVPQISSQRASSREDAGSSHPDWSGRGNSGGSQNQSRQQPRDQRQKSWIEALENAQ